MIGIDGMAAPLKYNMAIENQQAIINDGIKVKTSAYLYNC